LPHNTTWKKLENMLSEINQTVKDKCSVIYLHEIWSTVKFIKSESRWLPREGGREMENLRLMGIIPLRR
jgi:hypothetical protein